MVRLRYLSNFCIIGTGSANNQNPEFTITDTKLYVPVITLSTQENIRVLQQLESGFKRTINWNKYLAKTINRGRNRYLDYLIDRSFQGVNKLFAFLVKDDDGWESHKQYYIQTVEIKDYNVTIDGRNFFDQPIKNDLKIFRRFQ